MEINRIDLLNLTYRRISKQGAVTQNAPVFDVPVQLNNANSSDISFGDISDAQIEQAIKSNRALVRIIKPKQEPNVSEANSYNVYLDESDENIPETDTENNQNSNNNLIEENDTTINNQVNAQDSAEELVNTLKEKIGADCSRADLIKLSQQEDENSNIFGKINRIFTQLDFNADNKLSEEEIECVLNKDLLSDINKFDKYINKYTANIQNSYVKMSDSQKLAFIKKEAKLYLENAYFQIFGNDSKPFNIDELYENVTFSNDGAKYVTTSGEKTYLTNLYSDGIALDNSLKLANWYEAVAVLVKETILSTKTKLLEEEYSGYDDYSQINPSALDELQEKGMLEQEDVDWYNSHWAVYSDAWYIDDKLVVNTQKSDELKENLEILKEKIKKLNEETLEEFKANCVAENQTGYNDYSTISEYVLNKMNEIGGYFATEDEYNWYLDKVVNNPAVIKIDVKKEVKNWSVGNKLIESEDEILELENKLSDLKEKINELNEETLEEFKANCVAENQTGYNDYSTISEYVLNEMNEIGDYFATEDEYNWYYDKVVTNPTIIKVDEEGFKKWYTGDKLIESEDEIQELEDKLSDLKTKINSFVETTSAQIKENYILDSEANDYLGLDVTVLNKLFESGKLTEEEANWYYDKIVTNPTTIKVYKEEVKNWYVGDELIESEDEIQELEDKLSVLKAKINLFVATTSAQIEKNYIENSNANDYSGFDKTVIDKLNDKLTEEEANWYNNNWATKKESEVGYYIKNGDNYDFYISKNQEKSSSELEIKLSELKENINILKGNISEITDYSAIYKSILYTLKSEKLITEDEYTWYFNKWPYKNEEGDLYYYNGDYAGMDSNSFDLKIQEIKNKFDVLKEKIEDLINSYILTGEDVNEDDYSGINIDVLDILYKFKVIGAEEYLWYTSHWAVKNEDDDAEKPAGWYIKGKYYVGIDEEKSATELNTKLNILKTKIEKLQEEYYFEANQVQANYLDSLAGDLMQNNELSYIGKALAVTQELEESACRVEAQRDNLNNNIWQFIV